MAHPRNPKNWCSVCNKRIKNSSSGLCFKHWNERRRHNTGQKPINTIKATYARHRYQEVRNFGHRVMTEANIKKACKVCDYSVHVQLCHITPINTFPKTATLAEINELSNLVYLCPNHHWELDHKLLKL